MATDIAEWHPLTELRHRGGFSRSMTLPKEESRQVVEIKSKADGASANGG
jgi:hypothetical protein